MAELDHRLTIDKRFEQLFPETFKFVKDKDYPIPESDDDYECYKNLIELYEQSCGFPDTYTMKYFGAFTHQCQAIKYYSAALDSFKTNLSSVCPEKTE